MISEYLERTIRTALAAAGVAQAEHVAASIMRAIRAEYEGELIYIDRQCSARVAARNRIIAQAIADGASIKRLATRFGVSTRLIESIKTQLRRGTL